ncbi:nuclear transport factor 2 family protein [Candidatus Poriferisodalis sp.]|uniref:nuclear transport factor 2 family protein n=1 Tax=Candidatus Poriferisodalis sp. TaxID=3101277 RepID=UPI003B02A410
MTDTLPSAVRPGSGPAVSDPFPPQHLGSDDRAEIVQLTIDYCWALDTRDWEVLRRVFTPDAVTDLGMGGQRGVEEIIARVSGALNPLDDSQHLVGNHQIVIDGDTARGRCYLRAQHVREVDGGGSVFEIGGRYEDGYVRTSEGWRICRRTIIPMWRDGNVEVVLASGRAGASRGAEGRDAS